MPLTVKFVMLIALLSASVACFNSPSAAATVSAVSLTTILASLGSTGASLVPVILTVIVLVAPSLLVTVTVSV